MRRVSRACRELGVTPVVVYTEADSLSLHVLEASHKVCLGESPREYTNADLLLSVAQEQGCAPVPALLAYKLVQGRQLCTHVGVC